MSVPEPVILCDPFYHSSNWFQEIIAGFRDAAAKDRNNSPIHIHSMGTIGQLRLEPGIPVIVTNSSLKNLTSAVQQLRQAGIPVILSGVDGAHFGSDICSVASDSALAMTQMVMTGSGSLWQGSGPRPETIWRCWMRPSPPRTASGIRFPRRVFSSGKTSWMKA